ncbi:hypothetical protein AQUCO_00200957v1 [Aquilegia coerulea]|uniref:Uncharacterized protein n=1 Tax=Aquilegia coerulea TaxID=218851 RepID=A0A2G5F5I4_AQUCA|nr:hypothetical protein AQUCO_00200957v1 [Aquilegia coerulea]
MADKSYFMFCLCVCFLVHHLSLVMCQTPAAPAIYVFGDSLVDCGNNNYLVTLVRVNYTPYGTDFPQGPTGRYTNGKVVPDIIAQLLGLPLPPAFKTLNLKKFNTLTGVNYASGGGGIIDNTGKHFFQVLSFSDQINLFKKTIEHGLQPHFNPEGLQKHLSKSIFLINIGVNDYLNNYILPQYYNTSTQYTPPAYVRHLMKRLSLLLEILYNLGARKIVMTDLGPLGCIPSQRVKLFGQCIENYNGLVSMYNKLLPKTLATLRSVLPGSMFTTANTYDAIIDMTKNPSKYGFKDVEHPCCFAGDTQQLCIQDLLPCPNPDEYLFWDGFHPTQKAYDFIARGCFNGSSCSPMNIAQLVKA